MAKSNTPDPRDDFVRRINLDKSKILLKPYINFICGGKFQETEKTETQECEISIRQAIKDTHTDTEEVLFVYAETFEKWNDNYKTLSELEEDIAAISSQIIIILESEGAFVELGLFYANPKTRKKLILIIEEKYRRAKSFIRYGFIDGLKEGKIITHDIEKSRVDNKSQDRVHDIHDYIIKISNKKKNSKNTFKKDERDHITLLIHGLIFLFKALTENEIRSYLKKLNIFLEKKELKKIMYLLETFGMIIERQIIGYKFYCAKKKIVPMKIDFYTLDNKSSNRRIDEAEVSFNTIFYYKQKSVLDNCSLNKQRINVMEYLGLIEGDNNAI